MHILICREDAVYQSLPQAAELPVQGKAFGSRASPRQIRISLAVCVLCRQNTKTGACHTRTERGQEPCFHALFYPYPVDPAAPRTNDDHVVENRRGALDVAPEFNAGDFLAGQAVQQAQLAVGAAHQHVALAGFAVQAGGGGPAVGPQGQGPGRIAGGLVQCVEDALALAGAADVVIDQVRQLALAHGGGGEAAAAVVVVLVDGVGIPAPEQLAGQRVQLEHLACAIVAPVVQLVGGVQRHRAAVLDLDR